MSVNEGRHLDCESECMGCHEWFYDGNLVRDDATEDLMCRDCYAEGGDINAVLPERMTDLIAEYVPRHIEPEWSEPVEVEP